MTTVSIIITTHNRAAHLGLTLEAMAQLTVPDDYEAELLVVDNGSTDETAQVVSSAKLDNMNLVYLYEARRGKTTACNSAIAQAKGEILLWTDDDVRLPKDWIASMCRPILQGEAKGVSGKIRSAPHLERDWMTRTHYDRLSDTRFMPEDFGSMIGANMAFHRDVLQKVPGFDTELGPGKLGAMEETLFSYQMLQEGYQIVSLPQVSVDHHFDSSRLQRKAWLNNGEMSGKSQAYVYYHWHHQVMRLPILQLLFWTGALMLYRLSRPAVDLNSEGCHRFEIRLVQNISFIKQYLIERKRPRNYRRENKV